MIEPLHLPLLRRAGWRHVLLLIGLLFCLARPATAQQDLLGYWNFNSPEPSGNPWPAPIETTFGTGAITYNVGTDNLEDFSGDTSNAQGDDASGASFTVQDNAENGNHFDIAVSTENAENIELVFWTRRTGTGFDNNAVRYSTDGGATFTQAFSFTPSGTSSGAVETFDFSSIAALNDNPDVVFRITLDGATDALGNNRYDNITVRGDLQPASGPLALTAIDEPTRLNFQGVRAGGFDASPSLGQLDSDAIVIFGLSDGNLGFGGTATSGDFARGVSTGGETTGGVYAFDVSTPTDLSSGYGDYVLGLKPGGSDVTPGAVYLCYRNDTGTLINSGFDVAYDLWVLNDENRSQRIDLKYATGSTCQTDGDEASSFADSGQSFTIPQAAQTTPEWTRTAQATVLEAGVPDGDFLTLALVTDDAGGSGGRPQFGVNNIDVTPRRVRGTPLVISNLNDTVSEDFNAFQGTGFGAFPAPGQLTSEAFIVRADAANTFDFGDMRADERLAEGTNPGGAFSAGVYSFDVGGGDQALGVQPGADFMTDTPGALVARYQNDTGLLIDAINIAYDIEVFNDEARSSSFNLSYAVTDAATYPGDGAFTPAIGANYTSPQAADSSPTWQTVNRSETLTNLNLDDREYLLLQFTIGDAGGSGSRDELALNNLEASFNTATARFLTDAATVTVGDESASAGSFPLLVELQNPPSTDTDLEVEFDDASSTVSASDIGFTDPTTLTIDGGTSNPARATVATLDLSDPAIVSGEGTAIFTLTSSDVDVSTSTLTLTLLDPDAPNVLITEFMAAPSVNDSDGEWVELYNTTDSDIDLTGWQIDTPGTTPNDIGAVTIPARGFAVLCSTTDVSQNGGVRCDTEATLGLTNGGGTIEVFNNSSTSVTTVDYGSGNLNVDAGKSNVFTGTAQNNNADRWTVADRREKGFLFARSNPDRTDLGSPGQNGPEQQLQPTATIAGNSGWRMLAPPVQSLTVANLADQNMVQGVSDLPLGGDDNLYTWQSTGWTPAASGSEALPEGKGFIWYMWETSAPVSAYSPFPFVLDAEGLAPDTDVSVNVNDGGTFEGTEFHLLGNPYPYTFDLAVLNLADQNFSTTVQVWDPSANGGTGSYTPRTQGTPGRDRVAPWQGFFVERVSGSASTLTFSADGRRIEPQQPLAQPPSMQARITLAIDGRDAEGRLQTSDEALEVVLHPNATTGYDVHSAQKLTPMTGTYVTLAAQGTRNGQPTRQARYSLPNDIVDPVSIPLVVDHANAASIETLQIRWPIVDGFPDSWSVTLLDTATDTEVDLQAHNAYTADALLQSTAQETTSTRSGLVLPEGIALDAVAPSLGNPAPTTEPGAASRFILHIEPDAGTPLPVELTEFTVQTAGEAATVQWSTQSETNNAGFEVQHQGPQADTFTALGFVDGHGTTDTPQSYTFQANALAPGTHRFRLAQQDTDGTTTRTEPTEVTVQLYDAAQMQVYPVPVRSGATVQFAVDTAQHVRVEVYNMLGQRVRTLHEGPVVAHEQQTLQWPGRGLASGLYIVRLQGEHVQTTQRVTVVR